MQLAFRGVLGIISRSVMRRDAVGREKEANCLGPELEWSPSSVALKGSHRCQAHPGDPKTDLLRM